MHPLLQKMCVATYTVDDLHRRLGLLQVSLEEVLYHTDAHNTLSRKELCLASISTTASHDDVLAMSLWDTEVFETCTVENITATIAHLKKDIELLPRFELYVPTLFDAQGFALIGEWVRTNIHAQSLLDIRIDPSVIGGCAFVHNSAYHNYNFSYFQKVHKGEITKLLSSYV